jgi:hypothetical protein
MFGEGRLRLREKARGDVSEGVRRVLVLDGRQDRFGRTSSTGACQSISLSNLVRVCSKITYFKNVQAWETMG